MCALYCSDFSSVFLNLCLGKDSLFLSKSPANLSIGLWCNKTETLRDASFVFNLAPAETAAADADAVVAEPNAAANPNPIDE